MCLKNTNGTAMKYSEFDKIIPDLKMDICQKAYLENKDKIRVKKEKLVVKNLGKIFDATLEIGIQKGFQAMTMRDLSRVSGLSMGGMYSYFSSKEQILTVYLGQGRKIIQEVLERFIMQETLPVERLRTAVQVHLFLTEKMHEFFFFSYMEAKNLSAEERERSIQGELGTEKMLEEILMEGHKKGAFKQVNHTLSAGVIKAMLQDWYLKRGKYAKRNVHVDQYADFVMAFITPFCIQD
jgi:AcrR family transcriptional regulator